MLTYATYYQESQGDISCLNGSSAGLVSKSKGVDIDEIPQLS